MLCVCVCGGGGGGESQFTRSTNGILKTNLEGLKASLGRIWLLFGRKKVQLGIEINSVRKQFAPSGENPFI